MKRLFILAVKVFSDVALIVLAAPYAEAAAGEEALDHEIRAVLKAHNEYYHCNFEVQVVCPVLKHFIENEIRENCL